MDIVFPSAFRLEWEPADDCPAASRESFAPPDGADLGALLAACQAPSIDALSRELLERLVATASCVATLTGETFDPEPILVLLELPWGRALPERKRSKALVDRPRLALLSQHWSNAAMESGAGPLLASVHVLLWPLRFSQQTGTGSLESPGYRPSLAARRILKAWPPGQALEAHGLDEALDCLEQITSPVAIASPAKSFVEYARKALHSGGDGVAWIAGGGGAGSGSFSRTTGLSGNSQVDATARGPDALAQARADDSDEDQFAGLEELLVLSDRVPGAALTAAVSPRIGGALAEEWVTQEQARGVRPGRWTIGEFIGLLTSVRALDSPNPTLEAALLAVGAMGIPWRDLSGQLDPVAPEALEARRQPGLCLVRTGERFEGQRVLVLPTLPAPPVGTDSTLLHPVDHVIRLPLHRIVAESLWRALSSTPGTHEVGEADRAWLKWPTSGLHLPTYRQAYEELHKRGVRMDAGRVEWLFVQLLRDHASADDCAVQLLAGVRSEYAAKAHYWAAPWPKLWQCYLDTQARIGNRIATQQQLAGCQDEPASLPGPAGYRIGTPRAPLRETLYRALAGLSERVADTRPRKGAALQRWVEHHNARVVAWAFLLSCAWGLRRSRTSLHKPDQLMLEDPGWIVLRDKGQLRRMLPVSPKLLRVLSGWKRHLGRMTEAGIAWKTLSASPATQPLEALWSKAFLTMLEVRGHRIKARPWCPADTDAALKAVGIRLPMQLARQGVRVYLTDEGRPEFLVDALLGHHRRGLEPAGPWHGLSFNDLRQRLAKMVDDMLEDLGVTGSWL